MVEWVNHINKAYFNLAAPVIRVFKLDKTKTITDDLYNEEMYSRIYLPPFEVRAFHLDNMWRQLLGPLPYTEQEDNIQFIMNFENMVRSIRILKTQKISEMDIQYLYDGLPSMLKTGNRLHIKVDGSIKMNIDLEDENYNTIRRLGNLINALPDWKVDLFGKNDSSINIVSFDEVFFKDEVLQIFTYDDTYQNTTDVVELGDVILTNKWRLYEVIGAQPAGDFGWDWVQYMITCNLITADKVRLPGNYNEEINRRVHGIGHKLNME